MTICLKDGKFACTHFMLMNKYLILLQRCIIIIPYFTSGHQSSSCKGACTDVIRIQTQNDFYCFPSATFAPLHYLLNYIVFYINFWCYSFMCKSWITVYQFTSIKCGMHQWQNIMYDLS